MASRFVERDPEVAQPLRIDDHIILLHEAARAGNLGNASRLGETVSERPVLDRRVGEVENA